MMNGTPFQPAVWPEEPAPKHAVNCMLCELSRQRKRVVWGEGRSDAPLLVLLDNPGAREDPEGAPFVCGTRQTLQRAAAECGLGSDDIYVTFLLKCRPLRAYDKEVARTACLGHLGTQLALKRPKLLFLMGNTALQSFTGNPEADVKTMRGRWHELPLPAVGRFTSVSTIPAAVTYHPLAVRRRPNLYRLFYEDWQMVAERLRAIHS